MFAYRCFHPVLTSIRPPAIVTHPTEPTSAVNTDIDKDSITDEEFDSDDFPENDEAALSHIPSQRTPKRQKTEGSSPRTKMKTPRSSSAENT